MKNWMMRAEANVRGFSARLRPFCLYGEQLPSLEGVTESFYFTLAKDFFQGYIGSPQLANEVNSKFGSKTTADTVTTYLSGLLFIEDNSIEASSPIDQLKGYSFENARALNPVPEAIELWLSG